MTDIPFASMASISERSSRSASSGFWLVVMGACLWLAGCGSGSQPSASSLQPSPSPAQTFPNATSVPLPAVNDEASLLDAVFRIDIDSIQATFDVFAAERRVEARAELSFRMRPGQRRPIVHFDPARTSPSVTLRLDGAALDVRDSADVKLLNFESSGQISLELQRDLGAGMHTLEAVYSLPLTDPDGRFYTSVNDILGQGNESLFPTLNTPQELARHVLAFRVHAAEPYLAVGSGLTSATAAGDLQQWTFDSERPVASYTMMFHLATTRLHEISEKRLQGVTVRALAPRGGVLAEQAFAELDPWLAELQAKLGPFPMPRGLSLVLTQAGGGMEYYGATTTSIRALRHEVFHMYYGTSTVARTYRDSWWDEAIDMWYELSMQPDYPPIDDTYRSEIVNGRSAVMVGFDPRAYDQGSRIIQAVAREIGGRERMVNLLRDVHERRSFAPFSTWEFVDDIRAQTGADFRERFRLWLYQGPHAAAARTTEPSPWQWLHEVDLTLPGRAR